MTNDDKGNIDRWFKGKPKSLEEELAQDEKLRYWVEAAARNSKPGDKEFWEQYGEPTPERLEKVMAVHEQRRKEDPNYEPLTAKGPIVTDKKKEKKVGKSIQKSLWLTLPLSVIIGAFVLAGSQPENYRYQYVKPFGHEFGVFDKKDGNIKLHHVDIDSNNRVWVTFVPDKPVFSKEVGVEKVHLGETVQEAQRRFDEQSEKQKEYAEEVYQRLKAVPKKELAFNEEFLKLSPEQQGYVLGRKDSNWYDLSPAAQATVLNNLQKVSK